MRMITAILCIWTGVSIILGPIIGKIIRGRPHPSWCACGCHDEEVPR